MPRYRTRDGPKGEFLCRLPAEEGLNLSGVGFGVRSSWKAENTNLKVNGNLHFFIV